MKYKIWKTITIQKKPDLKGVHVSSWAEELLNKVKHPIKKEKIDLVKITLSDWFTEMPTTTEIYAKAKEEGLGLCPSQVGPQLRVEYKNQPLNEWLFIGMKPITGSGGNPSVFELYRDEDGTWLYGDWTFPDYPWGLGNRFVFRLRKSLRPFVPSKKLSSSDTLSLEKRVKQLEKMVKKLTGVIKI